MRGLTWRGKNDIRCDTVPDPKIWDRHNAIIKVTARAKAHFFRVPNA
jgi:threonine dehydrogenase-like Zn-dependent dehydrogenase